MTAMRSPAKLVACCCLFLSLLPSCVAKDVASALEFNASVWGPLSASVVTVVDHLDLTPLTVAPTIMQDRAQVSMFFVLEATVDLIRGQCTTPFTALPSSSPAMTPGQCHMLVSWGHVFLFMRHRSVWIDRLYIVEKAKPVDSATQIDNDLAHPSIILRVLDGGKLWTTRTTLVGNSDATAVSLGAATNTSRVSKACLSNCTVTNFAASTGWRRGPVFCSGHLALEETVFHQNRVGQPYQAIVDAAGPEMAGEVSIVTMQDVSFSENTAVHEVMKDGGSSRVTSDNPTHALTLMQEDFTFVPVPFDTLSPSEQGLLITTESPEFLAKVEKHGWGELTPPAPPPGLTPRDGSSPGTNGQPVNDTWGPPGPNPRTVAIIGSSVGVVCALLAVTIAAVGFVIWRKKSRGRYPEESGPYNPYGPNGDMSGGHGMPYQPVPRPGMPAGGPVWPGVNYGEQGGGGGGGKPPVPGPVMGGRGVHHVFAHPAPPINHQASLGSDHGSMRRADSAAESVHGPHGVRGPALPGRPHSDASSSAGASLVPKGPDDWSSEQLRSIMTMSQYVGGTSTTYPDGGPMLAAQTDFPTIPLPAPNPHFREGIEGIEDALDQLERSGALFMDKYTVTQGIMGRRVGGQGVVQFVRDQTSNDITEYAVKFFVLKEAFEAERRLYIRPDLRRMMPATREMVENADGRLKSSTGYVYPPCIVIEKGQSLEDFARTLDRGEDGYVTQLSKLTMLQAIIFVADRLRQLHEAGVVHRDIKPSNILRKPNTHDWTLIDFGCAAQAGEQVPITYSLFYAPPEVVNALEAGCKTIIVEKSMDAWALGMVAFEALTGKPALPRNGTMQDICNAITGRSALPWEGEGGEKMAKKLGRLGRTILACLDRNPAKRPTADVVVSSWNHMYSTMSATQASAASLTD